MKVSEMIEWLNTLDPNSKVCVLKVCGGKHEELYFEEVEFVNPETQSCFTDFDGPEILLGEN